MTYLCFTQGIFEPAKLLLFYMCSSTGNAGCECTVLSAARFAALLSAALFISPLYVSIARSTECAVVCALLDLFAALRSALSLPSVCVHCRKYRMRCRLCPSSFVCCSLLHSFYALCVWKNDTCFLVYPPGARGSSFPRYFFCVYFTLIHV